MRENCRWLLHLLYFSKYEVEKSPLVITTAPVITASPDLVVKNYFGYHTAETLGYSEASALSNASVTSIFVAETGEDEVED